MTKSNSSSNRSNVNRTSNRARPFVSKAGFTKTRREYGNGGCTK